MWIYPDAVILGSFAGFPEHLVYQRPLVNSIVKPSPEMSSRSAAVRALRFTYKQDLR
jgi:hypothetical protein